MLNIQDSKIILKNSTVSGQIPTVAPSNDHTDGSWDALDIYEGEMMSNVADSKVWMRMNNGIRELLVQRNNSATGDLYYWGGSTWQRVAIGTSGQVLTVSGGVPVWAASTGGGSSGGGAGGPTRMEYPTVLSRQDVSELLNSVKQDLTGYGATEDEVDFYYEKLRSKALKSPTVVTQTEGRSVTERGFNPQQFLIEKISGTDAAKERKVLDAYDAFAEVFGINL